jgi:hypothetical protein
VDSLDATTIAKPTNGHGKSSKSLDTAKENSGGSTQQHDESMLDVLDLAEYSTSAYSKPTPKPTGIDSAIELEEIDHFEHYVNGALAGCAGLVQISKQLFVVQGWDEKWQRSTVGWQHTGTEATS